MRLSIRAGSLGILFLQIFLLRCNLDLKLDLILDMYG